MKTRYLVSPIIFDDYEKAVAEATRQAEETMAGVSMGSKVYEIRRAVWVLVGEVIVKRAEPETSFEKVK